MAPPLDKADALPPQTWTREVLGRGRAVDLRSGPSFRARATFREAQDRAMMRLARAQALKCVSVPTAFDVGCVVCGAAGDVLSTGFRSVPAAAAA